MSQPRKMQPILVVLTVVSLVGIAGCGSSTKASSPASNPTTAAATTAAKGPTAAASEAAPTMTLDVSTGLTEGQKITVTAKGFPPNDNLGINECAIPTTGTVGAGDCDLRNLVPVQADAQGNVTGTKKVTKGPFGSNSISCTKATPCVLSVSELVAGNPKNASVPISFG
jgi:hypothetical protein